MSIGLPKINVGVQSSRRNADRNAGRGVVALIVRDADPSQQVAEQQAKRTSGRY